MGCDIHAAIEYRDKTGWHALMIPNKWAGKYADEPPMTARLDLNRDYDLFAILGNVRNGRGVAGCDMGDGFNFIGESRGLPEDISKEARELACTGDHSDTWVDLGEILGFDWTQVSRHRGVLSAVQFEKWDRTKEWQPIPSSYCGDVTGGGVEKVSPGQMRAAISSLLSGKRGKDYEEAIAQLPSWKLYTRIEWDEPYTYSARQIWERILPHMLKLATRFGVDNVRIVMNFDS